MRFKAFLRSILLILLAITMASGLCACTGKGAPDGNNHTPPNDSDPGNDTDSGTIEEEDPPAVASNLDEYVRLISSSLYSVNVASNKTYGLNDVKVGVNQKRFKNEMLYAFPADSEFAKIVDLGTLGFSESSSASDNSAVITSALESLKNVSGKKKLVFPAGTFELEKCIEIDGFADLYVKGNGTKLVMTEWVSAWKATNSSNVHLSDVILTYKDSPIMTGKILSYDAAANKVEISIDKNVTVSNKKYSHGIVYGYYDLEYNEQTKTYNLDTTKNLRYGSHIYDSMTVKSARQNTITLTFNPDRPLVKAPEVDDMVAIALSNYNAGYAGILSTNCTDTYYENVTLMSVPAMGVNIKNSKNAYFNRLQMIPDRSRNIYMATTADGIHTTGLEGVFVLTNSYIEGSQDDAMNVNTRWDTVASTRGEKLTLNLNGTVDLGFEKGHVIEIYDARNFAAYGEYTVTAVNGNVLTLDKDLDSKVQAGCLVGNPATATNLTVDNCIFTNQTSRGVLAQTRNSKITGCTFYNLGLAAVTVQCMLDDFHEGTVPRNVIVENNKIIKTNAHDQWFSAISVMAVNRLGYATPGSVRDVTINNNFISETGSSAVTFIGAGDCAVTSNLMHNLCRNVQRLGNNGYVAVGIDQSEDITLKSNYIYIDNDPNVNFVIWRDSDSSDITDENNVYKYVRNKD